MGVPISNVTRRVVFEASGTGPYAFTFEILANTDIAVYKDDVLLTLTTDYTVTINSNGTGSVTLTASPTGADQIAIVGDRSIQRTTDFVTGGDFFANSINDELDQQTIFAQQNAEAVERALKAPQTDPTTIDMTLPRASDRANKTLAFDADGNPVIGEIIGNNRGNWASGTAYNKRDLVKDTTNSNIYLCNEAHTSSGSLPISTNTASGKWDLLVDAAAAAESASDAADSATAAATSATNAASSASAASTSASSASTSASTATTKASEAATSATNAASSASTASTAATNASTSATAAASSASSASTSASTATTKASEASTSASNASSSASSASTSATNASNSASSASTSATNAASSATSAASSATSASSAQTAAESARDATLAAFDSFDDRYLGAKTSDPSVDNDGNALVAGALYFNSTSGAMKVYTGSAWVAAYVSGSGYLSAANNLSDVASASTARSNLGLVIGTNVQAWDADLDTWAGKTAPSGTVVGTSDTQTLTAKTIEAGTFTNGYTEEVATANTSTAYTIDLANGSVQILTLTGSCTFTFPTATAGKSFIMLLKQDGTGSRTVTWPSAVKWPSGTAPTITSTASKGDKYVFTADGTYWWGSNAGQNYL